LTKTGSQFKTNQTKLSILVSVILAAFWTILPLLGWSKYSFEDEITSCGLEYGERNWNVISYNIMVFTFGFFLPLTIICYSTSGLLRALQRGAAVLKREAENDSRMSRKGSRKSKNSQKSKNSHKSTTSRSLRDRELSLKLIVFIIGFFLTWMPYTIRALTIMFTDYKYELNFVIFSSMTSKTSLLWTPIFFIYSNKKVRDIIRYGPSVAQESISQVSQVSRVKRPEHQISHLNRMEISQTE